MRGKKGAAHFEMIVGIVFFMGFVMFMFMFMSPWSSGSLPSSALEGLHNSLAREINVPLSSVFVAVNYTGSDSCFYIDLPSELFKYTITDESSLVTRLGGVGIDSDLDGTGRLNLRKDDNFFRVAISPEFSDGDVNSCGVLNDFELGGVVELEVASYSKLTDLNNSYHVDYDGLKSRLQVAEIFDFAIVPEAMPEFVMKPENGVPGGVDVTAKEYVLKVLRSNGQISNERISVWVW